MGFRGRDRMLFRVPHDRHGAPHRHHAAQDALGPRDGPPDGVRWPTTPSNRLRGSQGPSLTIAPQAVQVCPASPDFSAD